MQIDKIQRAFCVALKTLIAFLEALRGARR